MPGIALKNAFPESIVFKKFQSGDLRHNPASLRLHFLMMARIILSSDSVQLLLESRLRHRGKQSMSFSVIRFKAFKLLNHEPP